MFCKAMLKLTNSFCRYLKLTCEKVIVNKTHIRCFKHLSYRGNECGVHNNFPSVQISIATIDTGQQLRFLANYKKKSRQKKLSSSNDSKKNKSMSDSIQPTLNHVSFGGQFDVSAASNEEQRNTWQRQFANESGSKINADKREKSVVPQNFRVWEPVFKKIDNDGNTFKFRIMSYNVLAQYLLECHPYLYTECSSQNLKWSVRAERLYDEITEQAPDIICLQEVQASHLDNFYARFEQIGYYGIYKQKTGHRHDGCSIYFKRSMFELVDHISVEFHQPNLPILNRDNIGMMVKLMPKNFHGMPIVVATTHLLYNPKRTDVRLAQIQVFLAEIDRFSYYNNGRERGHLPIIMTGDLNSTPESAVIKLLDKGHVSASPFRDTSDWKRIGVTDTCQHLSVVLNRQFGWATDMGMIKIYNSDCTTVVLKPDTRDYTGQGNDYSELFNTGVVGHSLKLKSVYNKYNNSNEHEATTFQDYWVTVDYIYFSCCSNLRLLERLRLPTAAECEVLGLLPNDVYGSDHLALAATFELLPCKSL